MVKLFILFWILIISEGKSKDWHSPSQNLFLVVMSGPWLEIKVSDPSPLVIPRSGMHIRQLNTFKFMNTMPLITLQSVRFPQPQPQPLLTYYTNRATALMT